MCLFPSKLISTFPFLIILGWCAMINYTTFLNCMFQAMWSYLVYIVRVPIGYFSKRVHPKGVVEIFAFFGSLDGPEQNKT